MFLKKFRYRQCGKVFISIGELFLYENIVEETRCTFLCASCNCHGNSNLISVDSRSRQFVYEDHVRVLQKLFLCCKFCIKNLFLKIIIF